MAMGGVVDKPTLALVGEAGPELVMPLAEGGILGYGASAAKSAFDELYGSTKSWLGGIGSKTAAAAGAAANASSFGESFSASLGLEAGGAQEGAGALGFAAGLKDKAIQAAAHSLITPALAGSTGLSPDAINAGIDLTESALTANPGGILKHGLSALPGAARRVATTGIALKNVASSGSEIVGSAQAHADANPIRLSVEAPTVPSMAPARRNFARAQARRRQESETRSTRWEANSDIGYQ
jgi:hypothetical protein